MFILSILLLTNHLLNFKSFIASKQAKIFINLIKEKHPLTKTNLKMKKNKIFIGLFFMAVLGAFIYYIVPEKELPKDTKIDKIVVLKSKRELQAYANGQLLKTYKVSLGAEPNGDKEFEGDKKTPEGIYYINDKNPNSDYYKNLGVSYPNNVDQRQAKKLGKLAGGDIKIHGLKNNSGFIGKFHRWYDWTLGCIAVTNQEIDELYNAVSVGTPIEIKP